MALHQLCKEGNLIGLTYAYEQTPELFAEKDECERTLLHIVCKRGHLNCAKFIISLQCLNIEEKDMYGNTALHYAVCFNKEYDGIHGESGHVELVRTLMQNGANIHKNKHGDDPLTLAYKLGDRERIIEMLRSSTSSTTSTSTTSSSSVTTGGGIISDKERAAWDEKKIKVEKYGTSGVVIYGTSLHLISEQLRQIGVSQELKRGTHMSSPIDTKERRSRLYMGHLIIMRNERRINEALKLVNKLNKRLLESMQTYAF